MISSDSLGPLLLGETIAPSYIIPQQLLIYSYRCYSSVLILGSFGSAAIVAANVSIRSFVLSEVEAKSLKEQVKRFSDSCMATILQYHHYHDILSLLLLLIIIIMMYD